MDDIQPGDLLRLRMFNRPSDIGIVLGSMNENDYPGCETRTVKVFCLVHRFILPDRGLDNKIEYWREDVFEKIC